MWTARRLGGLPAVGPCQQSVETIVGAGVIFFVVDMTVVDAGAGKRGLVHKQGAVAISGPTWCQVLREREKVTVSFSDRAEHCP